MKAKKKRTKPKIECEICGREPGRIEVYVFLHKGRIKTACKKHLGKV